MPLELPEGRQINPFALMGKTPPNVSAMGGRSGAPGAAPVGQAPGAFDEADAGEAYRKQHYRQHVERFPDGTPVITGTGTPDEHKGFWNRFKHALQGMGLGAMQAMSTADPRDPNALMRALGGAIGGGATAGWNPENADRLYNRVLVDPEADRQRQKQLINQKIQMEKEEHQGKLLDQESLRQARAAQTSQGQAQTDINRRRIDLDERLDPEKIKVERERIAAQERERAATTAVARSNWSVPPGHTYKDEQGNIRIAQMTPDQLNTAKGTGSNTQQWSNYVANVGTPAQRAAAAPTPPPNDIVAFAIQNNMRGGDRPDYGQETMEILQAVREGSIQKDKDGNITGVPYGKDKTLADQDRVKEAQKYFEEANKFFRDSLERQYIATDQQVRQQLLGQQQQGGAVAPPQQGGGGARRPGTNARTEGGISKNINDLVK
jgi:hypothetical protein